MRENTKSKKPKKIETTIEITTTTTVKMIACRRVGQETC